MTQVKATNGMFIRVEVAAAAAQDKELAKKLDEVCPVNIFKAQAVGVEILEENLDECVLCGLCVEAAPPGGVRVRKLYSGEMLER